MKPFIVCISGQADGSYARRDHVLIGGGALGRRLSSESVILSKSIPTSVDSKDDNASSWQERSVVDLSGDEQPSGGLDFLEFQDINDEVLEADGSPVDRLTSTLKRISSGGDGVGAETLVGRAMVVVQQQAVTNFEADDHQLDHQLVEDDKLTIWCFGGYNGTQWSSQLSRYEVNGPATAVQIIASVP
eukprot:GHVH01003909.1.p1 GENE.GHVH01003909.1~~GHVH01003909.1.p1  ORF type:complete len:188 (+),score=28.83 GHVH01003909.1:109-672(+)